MKKKKFLVQLISIISLILIIAFTMGCSNNSSNEPSSENKQQNETEQPSQKGSDEPQYGGTLRVIKPSGPSVLSYYLEMGPNDSAGVFPGAELLLVATADRTVEPVLAKEYAEDPDAKTITFWLHEGVKFHDGTEMTADVVKWNFETFVKKLQFNELLDRIEVVDDYTLVLHVREWHNQILYSWGSVPIFSRDAYEKNGGADWARHNIVGTGPFMLKEHKRDVSTTWVRFNDYWREGQPYLDRVEIIYVPEATTAKAMMLNGEADIWAGASAQFIRELEDEGFVRQSGWAGNLTHVIPNTVDKSSPFSNIKVREALEYAINREALCEALGYGYSVPLYRVVPELDWGGNNEPLRKYDPEKAKNLLAEAGYPEGLKIEFLAPVATGGRNETAEAIANYLREAGFIVELDIADSGRYTASLYQNGWKDIVMMSSGPGVTPLVSCHRWWGPYPMTNIASLSRPDDFIAICDRSLQTLTQEDQKAATKEIADYIAENALVIPIFNAPGSVIHNGKVHTHYPDAGFTRWDHNDMWLEQ